MKKIIWLVIFLGILLVLGIFYLQRRQSRLIPKVILGNSSVVVEIADTEQKIQQGLSDRENLCSSCGMLFIFKQSGVFPFWMRRMYFDIDMIWIKDGRVVDITHNAKVPPSDESEAPRTTYQSRFPVDMVLEVNSGWAKKNKIEIGTNFNLVR